MKSLAALALLLASAVVQAQPITVSNPVFTSFGDFFGGTPGTFQWNIGYAYSFPADSTGFDYAFNLRGDVTAQMTGTATLFAFQGTVGFTLTTGAAPVQLSDITVSFNGKEVVSGGSAASFTARNVFQASLNAPSFGYDFVVVHYLPERTASGVFIEEVTFLRPSTLLAANTDYTLFLSVGPTLSIDSYPPTSSMLGYALEFGGTVAPWLDGLTVSFTAQPVPEPASLLMLGAGVAALLARRRRAG